VNRALQWSSDLSMEFYWIGLAVIGVIVGAGIIIVALRNRKHEPVTFNEIAGVLKQDWTRTGNIDFHVPELNSALPQALTLRVEEKKITENQMGRNVVQLRWRLATLEEGKEVVAHWSKSDHRGQPLAIPIDKLNASNDE
jgi:hypothetical protein